VRASWKFGNRQAQRWGNSLCILIYILLGMFTYRLVEHKYDHDSVLPAMCNETELVNGTEVAATMRKVRWTYIDALYFCMSTMSTVGYGDLSPLTDESSDGWMMTFTIMYIFVGIATIFPLIANTITCVTDPLFASCRQVLEQMFPPLMVDLDGNGTPDFRVPDGSAFLYYAKGAITPVLFFMAVQIIFAYLFLFFEPQWDYGRSIYHCIVTATTVGYGDVPILTQEGEALACVHILISVSLLAAMIADVDGLRQTRRSELKRGRQFLERINVENILSLDVEGNGVDKFEFVIGMLIRLEAVEPADVSQFMAQFEQLNCGTDGDGVLTRVELEQYAVQQTALAESSPEMQAALRQIQRALGDEMQESAPPQGPPTPLRQAWSQASSASAGDDALSVRIPDEEHFPHPQQKQHATSALSQASASGRADPLPAPYGVTPPGVTPQGMQRSPSSFCETSEGGPPPKKRNSVSKFSRGRKKR